MRVKTGQRLERHAELVRSRLTLAAEAMRRPDPLKHGCDAKSLPFFVEVFFLPGLELDAVFCEAIIADQRIDPEIRWIYRTLRAEIAKTRIDVSQVIAQQRPLD